MKVFNVVTKDENIMSVFSAYWCLKIYDRLTQFKESVSKEKKGQKVLEDQETFNFLMKELSSELKEYLVSDMGYEEREGIARMTEAYRS